MKIGPKTLREMFFSLLGDRDDVSLLNDGMPFLLKWNDRRIYIYIKTLSSAYFQNENITRVQLPWKEEFEKIKRSKSEFIFLGYDPENNVFVSWDCHIAKKRLNQSQNVSFYSRLDAQQSAKGKMFKRFYLDNGEQPIVFKTKNICSFIDRVDEFFPKVLSLFDITETYSAKKGKNDNETFDVDEKTRNKLKNMISDSTPRMLEALSILYDYFQKNGISKSIPECSNYLNKLLND